MSKDKNNLDSYGWLFYGTLLFVILIGLFIITVEDVLYLIALLS